jgi:hypothetical protein
MIEWLHLTNPIFRLGIQMSSPPFHHIFFWTFSADAAGGLPGHREKESGRKPRWRLPARMPGLRKMELTLDAEGQRCGHHRS